MVSGADNGTMQWFDWRTGYNFQRYQAPVQPGSLDSESGIFALAFDKSESRLISCEGDKVSLINTASQINFLPFRLSNFTRKTLKLQKKRTRFCGNQKSRDESDSRANSILLPVSQYTFKCVKFCLRMCPYAPPAWRQKGSGKSRYVIFVSD